MPKPTKTQARYLAYLAMSREELIARFHAEGKFRVQDKTVQGCINLGWARRVPTGGVELTEAGRALLPAPEAPAAWVIGSVKAEDAPIGVQLWPTRSPKYAPNFTLARVEVMGEGERSWVQWTYESGTGRVFALGESVAVQTREPLPSASN
jgi:hypothetical protein